MNIQTIQFPNPMKEGMTLDKVFMKILEYPLKSVCYQVRNSLTKQNVLYGIGKNAAKRMGSLLPKENGGRGTRNNNAKRQYCWENLKNLEIEVMYFDSREEAKAVEDVLRQQKNHIFNT